MELEKLLRSLLYRLESIDDESKSTVIEDKTNKLSGPGAIAKTIEAKKKAVQTEKSMLKPYVLLTIFLPKARHAPL